ncbi:MAG: hypothetical protein WAP52_02105 [Candidatus Sungiibacteriota bacterium]
MNAIYAREGVAFHKDSEKETSASEQSLERNREHIFRSIITQKLLSEIEDALGDNDFSDEEIDRFETYLRTLPEERVLGVLAVPYELKNSVFGNARKAETTPEALVRQLDESAQKYGFTVGYHISRARLPIMHDQKNPDQETWNIIGNELDDRDDMNMAYYSLDYENLFRKNRGTFLYLVRAELGSQTAHKRDLKNNWGRAPQLSIIAEFNIIEIEEKLRELLPKKEE